MPISSKGLYFIKGNKAMNLTLNNTLPQMFVTTIAALIGFRAMALGQLTLLGDLSTMMSLGILFCFLAAVTIIPPILILNEKLTHKNKIISNTMQKPNLKKTKPKK